ncbi:MAG: hypothetical protein H0V30_09995 [Chitinophagaceae bacterium]|nr:hypothetical protein [Chitinophagaceae bacterium]
MCWLDFTPGLFSCVSDNFSRPRTFREIYFTDFNINHDWFYKNEQLKRWISGNSNDLQTQMQIRSLNPLAEDSQQVKLNLKLTLQCYTSSAYYTCKKKGEEVLVDKLPILCLDWDHLGNHDLEYLKKQIFEIPSVCFVSKSVGGKGLFALFLIAEPEKLQSYAEHFFIVFDKYGLKPDTTKGRNYTDLRLVSYDCNMLIRDYPAALKVKRFSAPVRATHNSNHSFNNHSGLVKWAIKEINSAQVGQRFEIVRKVSYAMGGRSTGLENILDAIKHCSQYAGVETKYLTHAEQAFAAGKLKPICN